MLITASEVALVAHGTLVGLDCEASGIAFDSRTLRLGQAFVALGGDADGHDFLQAAATAGAPFAIVQRGRSISALTCVEVDDCDAALTSLGRHCRDRLSGSLKGRAIGITGSVGKTSTKDLVLAVLRSKYTNAHAPEKSLNNDIGVPVTIINAPDSCEALVLEMGMRGLGEIARLCDVGHPQIGVITEVGDAHSERVGGIEGVVRAKAELVQSLPSSGVAIVNSDSVNAMKTVHAIAARVMTFGSSETASVKWEIVSTDDRGCCTVRFTSGEESAVGVVPLPGIHMASNAASAVAVGITCGIEITHCVEALSNAQSASQRMQWVIGRHGLRILDDSYNANPMSVAAALRTVAETSAKKRFAVLGVMAEVLHSDVAHQEIATLCRQLGIELLAVETDLYGTAALSVADIANILGELDSSSVVLVKGSRVAATERVVHAVMG
ncbi:MAG: UDP-N-acetylmuramoyl-tripeptide--D-alanyl-D-alanine ligase [Ilumatobacteraceae bacterium]|nr:UDP-N-acetylmuramoyl-tripeptide--D-alanyl-D-alanine ligase [Ilumatobacteraceae bacterium]